MRVCLGGTFDPFHVGHEALLRRAFEADEVFVGVTAGDLATRDRDVATIEARIARVEAFAESEAYASALTVRPLEDAAGPAATGDYDAIVVSPETVAGAAAINQERERNALAPLDVWRVPHVLGDDLLPVSGTRIHAGAIDRDGRRLRPVQIVVGSENPVKLRGVEQAFARILGDVPFEVRGVAVDSKVPEQPRDAQTMHGAGHRARGAADAGGDYAVGVEAGLNGHDDRRWYDMQACVVLDATGLRTEGWGPGFQYPDWVLDRALAGEMVSDILGPVAEDDQIGGTTGAIGFLTGGRMDRAELTSIAVLMAFLPRIRRDLY